MTTWLIVLSTLVGFSLAVSMVAARIAIQCVISSREALTRLNGLLAKIEKRVDGKPKSSKDLPDNVTIFPSKH